MLEDFNNLVSVNQTENHESNKIHIHSCFGTFSQQYLLRTGHRGNAG